jgi:hypothetical protein
MKIHTSSGIAACIVWVTLVGVSGPILAQTKAAPAGTRSYEDILKAIPQQDFLKLRGNGKAEAALQLSQVLIQNNVEKDATFAIKIAKVDPWQFARENITGTRITAEEEKIRMGSVTITTNVFIHIVAPPTDAVSKLKRGQKIVATGKVTRCDLTVFENPILTIDVNTDSVTLAAK